MGGGGGGRGEREKERRWISVEPLVDGEGWRREISGLSELTTVSIFVGVWESEMGEGGGERERGGGERVVRLYKLNRLHMHLADDEGWRLEISGLSELTTVSIWERG